MSDHGNPSLSDGAIDENEAPPADTAESGDVFLPAPTSADEIVRGLISVCYRKDGLPLAVAGALDACRAWFRVRGINPSPVGDSNDKTAALGSYREVGPTCPDSCAQLALCFGLKGPVALSSRRASRSTEADVAAFAIAGVVSWVCRVDIFRGNVVGDLGKTPDPAFVLPVVAVLRALRKYLAIPEDQPVAWGYSHHALELPLVQAVIKAGWYLRASDVDAPNGAIIAETRDDLRATLTRIRSEGRKAVACPAQHSSKDRPVTCIASETSRGCRGCFEWKDVTIVFLRH